MSSTKDKGSLSGNQIDGSCESIDFNLTNSRGSVMAWSGNASIPHQSQPVYDCYSQCDDVDLRRWALEVVSGSETVTPERDPFLDCCIRSLRISEL